MLSVICIFIYGPRNISANIAPDSSEVFADNNATVNSIITSKSALDSRNYIANIQITIKNVSQYTVANGYVYLPFAADQTSNQSAPVKWDSSKEAFVYPAGYNQPVGTELSITNPQVSNKSVTLEYVPRGSIARYLTQNTITYLPTDTVPRIYFGPLQPGSSITVNYTIHLTSPEGTNVNSGFALNRSIRVTYKQAYLNTFYKDTQGNEISNSSKELKYVGDTYSTVKKDIVGYTFKQIDGYANGQLSAEGQSVTYVYTKDIVSGGDVTANYVDENGKTISDQVVRSGNVGDEYSTEQKNIDGYRFKEVQGNATGTFTADSQTVTYVYTKNQKAPENPVRPDGPEKPVIPDNGNTSSMTNNNTTVNNTTTNNEDKTVKKTADDILPKTAAEKVGVSAMFAAIILVITGGLIFKKRHNKQ